MNRLSQKSPLRKKNNLSDLSRLTCIPCRGGVPPLTEAEIADLRFHVLQWDVVAQNAILCLQRSFKFKNFTEALAFTNQVAAIAEAEDHHPLIVTEWGQVTVQWWTHVIKGLHRNDFIMAAKTDEIFSRAK
jgi:4a-hydroxytetrahydrobiopterin dehydratase